MCCKMEDFDVKWLENSGRIDELPAENLLDIHGDFGNHCYKNFRHSLCHGWSSGIFALFVEEILGIKIENGRFKGANPNLFGLKYIKANIIIGDEIIKFDINKERTLIEK